MKKNHTNMPLVSVVIPVFNGAKYLEETIYSVQNSSYKKIEVLLIDDRSTDKSREIGKYLSKKYKNVKFYAFSKNKGLGRVLNFALQKAKGEFICRINQDDLMYRYRIVQQVKFLENNPEVVAVGSWIKLFDKNDKCTTVKFLEEDEAIKKVWHLVSPFSDPSVMYRKEIALKVGGYHQEFWPADDTHLWIRMGMVGKLANIAKPLVGVRYHENAASIKYFRKLALVTYQMHRWMHENIAPASIPIQIFWLLELVSELTLSPYLNWSVYRLIKRIIYAGRELVVFFRQINLKDKITVKSVISQPAIASRSGQ